MMFMFLIKRLLAILMWALALFVPIYSGILFSWGWPTILFLLIVSIAYAGALTALMDE